MRDSLAARENFAESPKAGVALKATWVS